MYSKPVVTFVNQCIIQGNEKRENGKTDRVKTSEMHNKFLVWAEDKSLDVSEYNSARLFRKTFTEVLDERGLNYHISKNSIEKDLITHKGCTRIDIILKCHTLGLYLIFEFKIDLI